MPRIRFMDTSRNHWVKVTTTPVASSAATALPASNSQTQDRTQVWRSLQQTGVQTLDVDLGSSVALTAIAVANVKLVGTGALLLYAGATLGAETTLVATLPAQDRDSRTSFFFFGTASRYWRLKWTNPTSASDYAEIGYVHLGTFLEPTINPTVPTPTPRMDPSVRSESVDGQVTFVRRTKFSSGQWRFEAVPDAQLDNFRDMFDTLGSSGVFFQVLDTALAWTSWLSRFTGLEPVFADVANRYHVSMGWEEVR